MKNTSKQPAFTSSKSQNTSSTINVHNTEQADKDIEVPYKPPRPTNCLLHACVCM